MLITMLVIGAVGIAITISLILLGLGAGRTSLSRVQSVQARALSFACAEEALQQIRDNTSYAGKGSLALGSGTCDYNVVSGNNEIKYLYISGTVGLSVRKIYILVTAINPSIIITTWSEVAD